MKPSLLPAAFALALLGTLAAAGSLRAADDTTRRAQQALRDGGFYYGPINGTPGDDTTQAIRRYQIRNGLAVSGQLNAETLRSLNINAPPPPSAPADRPARSDNNRPQRPEPTPPPLSTPTPPPRATPTRPAPTPAPPPPRASQPASPPPSSPYNRPDLRVAPLPPGAQSPSVPLTGFFSRTPYEFAPPAVQADVLRRAQRSLREGGFYDGPFDGQPGRRTVEALGELQGAYRLQRTGRLDTMTLRFLRLMPDRGSNLPEPIPSRRRGAPDPDEREEDEDDDGPPVRVRPRPSGPEVYQGRIIR